MDSNKTEIFIVVGWAVCILPVNILYSLNAVAVPAIMPCKKTVITACLTNNRSRVIGMVLYLKMTALTAASECRNGSLCYGQCLMAGVATGNPASRGPVTGWNIQILV